jgi:hypothetical protein
MFPICLACFYFALFGHMLTISLAYIDSVFSDFKNPWAMLLISFHIFRAFHRHQARILRFFMWHIFFQAFCLILEMHTWVWILENFLLVFLLLNMVINTF